MPRDSCGGSIMMRCLNFMYFGLVLIKGSSALHRSIDDHIDSGTCTGEFRPGNSPFVPQRYSLYLDLNPKERKFLGDVNITGTLSNQTNEIILHSVNLIVNSVRVNGIDLDHTHWDTDDTTGGTLNIRIQKPSKNHENVIVGVSYAGLFNDTTGIIMQKYDKTDENRWIIFTHLEPISARTVFPCIDLPKYKAKFDISIRNNFPELVVLSNMPMKSYDLHAIRFLTTPLMSTYLVSFVVCDYLPVRNNHRKYKSRNITTWVPKEMKRKYETHMVSALVPRLLGALEEYTGNNYSLPKLDAFVVMDKPGIGGMENWGLIMYQSDSLIQGKRVAASDTTRVIFTIAHELAHHWFGNSVTVADWCGMWFQEAIPTFLHGLIPEQYISDLDMRNRVKWTARKEVMDSECFFYDESSPLRDVENPRADEGKLFTFVRYYKGASLLFMIESMVTSEVFKKSLRSFIGEHNESYTIEDELWRTVERTVGEGGVQGKLAAPAPLAEIAGTWVTNKSHPVVVVSREKDGSLFLGQRVCLPALLLDGEWWIPISYTTSNERYFNNTRPRSWIHPSSNVDNPISMGIKLQKNEWIVLNVNGSGFYRVEYDDLTWKLIIEQLKNDTAGDPQRAAVPPINRAMLVDDSFHTAISGEGLVRVFDILEYIGNETSTYVWEAMVINVGYHYAQFPEDERLLFKKYLQFLLKDVFYRVANISQWNSSYFSKLETVNDRSVREPVFDLSHTVELPALYKFSNDTALKIISNEADERIIPPEVKTKFWCAAVAGGNQKIYNHVNGLYYSEKDARLKAEILERLQCSKNHAKQLLDLMRQNNVDGDKSNFRKNLKDFLVNHWPAECKEILSFFEKYKLEIVDDASQWRDELKSEFQEYVKRPMGCKVQTEEIFGPNSNDDMDDYRDWKETYGRKPLEWLKNHERLWA